MPNIEYLLLWFLLYSCVGWVYESVLVSVLERRWVNRGFLNGPICPIYGAGAVLGILLLSGLRDHPVIIFLISALGASVLEFVTSWAMEKIFHARWWDYSDYRFNIQGRVSLLGAVVFGAAGVALIELAQPWVAQWTVLVPMRALHALRLCFIVLFVIDMIVTIRGMVNLNESLRNFSEMIQSAAERTGESCQWGKDVLLQRIHEWSSSSQEILASMRSSAMKTLNRQQRRMIQAFPNLRSTESVKESKIIETVRELLRRK